MKYTKEQTVEQYNLYSKLTDSRPEFLLFWGHTAKKGSIGKECLSQWYDCTFEVGDGNADIATYRTAEQYMMARKALLFGDNEVYDKIMDAGSPDEFKKLGQQVRGFDEEKWKAARCDIVIRGNYAKFSQDRELKAFLLSTGTKILVEASPYDRTWGIGMSANDSRSENPNFWRGTNLLGFCLMEVRDMLAAEE